MTSTGDIRVRVFMGKAPGLILMCFYGCNATVFFMIISM